MLSLLLVSSMAMSAPNYSDYYTASNVAIKEKKMLFVWRGIKDDYIIKRYPNAVHCFDPVGLNTSNLIRKGVIVSLPNNDVLVVKIETESVGELVFKLIEMKEVKIQTVKVTTPKTQVVVTSTPKVKTKVTIERVAPIRTFFGNNAIFGRSQCANGNCPN